LNHIIIKSINKYVNDERDFQCIPNNKEKFISFSLGIYKFIDSYQFMSESLENLTKNLTKSEEDKFNYLNKEIKNKYGSLDNIKLLKQKGVYPYDYVDDINKFNEPLPEHNYFYSQLSMTNIKKEEYEHAKNVYNKFNCKNFGDYHDLYLLSDVLLNFNTILIVKSLKYPL
jgi:hypothetical protein